MKLLLFQVMLCSVLPGFAPLVHAEPTRITANSLAEESAQERLQAYREVLRQEKRLLSYNNQVDRMITAQEEEMASFTQQLRDIEITNSEMLPFILKMFERLEQFVSLDLPFLAEKRRARLNMLRALIDRPDLSVAAKYRYVMQAYQGELAYGRTIEATTASIDQGAHRRMMHLLRIGRVALYSLSFDGKEAAYWDQQQGQWQGLSGNQRRGIEQGLRIARKEAPPNLLKLPIMAPEISK